MADPTYIQRWDRFLAAASQDTSDLRAELRSLKERSPRLADFVDRTIAYAMILRRHLAYRDSGRITAPEYTPVGPEPPTLEALCRISPSACRCYSDPVSCAEEGPEPEPVPYCPDLWRTVCGAAECITEICEKNNRTDDDERRLFDCMETLSSGWADLVSAGCVTDSRVLPNSGALQELFESDEWE